MKPDISLVNKTGHLDLLTTPGPKSEEIKRREKQERSALRSTTGNRAIQLTTRSDVCAPLNEAGKRHDRPI
jgi:hypothetical protein